MQWWMKGLHSITMKVVVVVTFLRGLYLSGLNFFILLMFHKLFSFLYCAAHYVLKIFMQAKHLYSIKQSMTDNIPLYF